MARRGRLSAFLVAAYWKSRSVRCGEGVKV